MGEKLKTLWLDPDNTVKKKDLTVMEKIGFKITPVQSLEDLKRLIVESDLAILKISNDVSLLREIKQLMTIMKKDLVIFCRLDTNSINLSADLKKHGCTNIILSDDFSKLTWQNAFDKLNKSNDDFDFIFKDPKSVKLLELAKKVGQSGVSTLITGPSGSGKEVLAQVLHKSSSRKNEQFIALNCAAIPENLIEDQIRDTIRNEVGENFDKIGISLSSGIDSTLVLALLRKEFPSIKIESILGLCSSHSPYSFVRWW